MSIANDNQKRRLLTPREAAAYLTISERTLWSMRDRGEVPAVQFGRLVRYDVRDLDRLIESCKTGMAVESVR